MRPHDELTERIALHRREKLGLLSESAYRELVAAVRKDPSSFLDDPSDMAFSVLVDALDRYDKRISNEETLDDDQWRKARKERLSCLASECENALAIDPACSDAALCQTLARNPSADELIASLFKLEAAAKAHNQHLESPAGKDAWANVFAHGYLRIRAAIARACINTSRYRMAEKVCKELLAMSPQDEVGARYTYALALARLEDEAGFDELDARGGRRGNSWLHLSRVILLYKLDRMSSAKRALCGFSHLVEGGAYALLRPIWVDSYIPDRPEEHPCSFGEATLAVHEADPIIVDTPDLIAWAEDQPEVARDAKQFANARGFTW
ncbi:MAG: hypothetical protein LIV22_00850 [Olegusella sp.]|jgi:tetratricopeptide (TPR) repeat protein|nr:hypothetical protein [Olegusella sp.]NLH91553.1 hypothetical protein [Atopobium sp.]